MEDANAGMFCLALVGLACLAMLPRAFRESRELLREIAEVRRLRRKP